MYMRLEVGGSLRFSYCCEEKFLTEKFAFQYWRGNEVDTESIRFREKFYWAS